ncbi:hypothetical protein N7509_009133 [Penicillium cosmopolitanum]|uniref:Mid2 domain-containing protein n=1 Tax=Penicillium cosmopolitanum TaxID=1131564 RepID=A0A9W9VNX7_9EURO|nr:uncharacterized protein N7509_009133 [Penicillium cosmopolitanum]KAJ5386592.1 hypothetical protein N7509_009133 [Penicillium cosmopolitanum]
MRLARLSFLAHALLLTAVAAQSVAVTDLVNSVTSDSSSSSEPATSADPTTSSSSSSSTSSSSSSSSSSSEQPTTTSADPTTSSSSSSKSTTSAENTADNTSKTTSSKNNEPTKTSSEDSSSTSDAASTTQTPVVETITSYQTVSGSTVPHVMTSTSTPAAATSPSLSGDNSSNSSSGVSDSDKKIIIGVVVGVGGAIVIGVLAIVIWRIQKKRNGQYNEEDDDLMGGTAVGSGPREKVPSPAAGTQGTPFKSTLDQYHNPGPVNAASNF